MKIVFYIILTVFLLLYAIDENHQRVEVARGKWKTEMLTRNGYPPIDEPGFCFYCTYIKPLIEDNEAMRSKNGKESKSEDNQQGIINWDEPEDVTQTINFFGKEVNLNNRIMSQLKKVASHDKNISIKDNIIKVGDVEWGINVSPDYIMLYSSIQPNDPRMKFVKEYLTGIYGEPYDDEYDGLDIKWSSSPDHNNIFAGGCTLVHLRRVHTEEGGTLLIFQ